MIGLLEQPPMVQTYANMFKTPIRELANGIIISTVSWDMQNTKKYSSHHYNKTPLSALFWRIRISCLCSSGTKGGICSTPEWLSEESQEGLWYGSSRQNRRFVEHGSLMSRNLKQSSARPAAALMAIFFVPYHPGGRFQLGGSDKSVPVSKHSPVKGHTNTEVQINWFCGHSTSKHNLISIPVGRGCHLFVVLALDHIVPGVCG